MAVSDPLKVRELAHGDGFVTVYGVLGPKEGRTIMLVHGLAASAAQFDADAAHLAQKGYRVIVPNLRGHGASRFPARNTGADFSIEKLAGDLLAVLDAEQIEAVDWIGNSLGGIVALRLMPDYNHRLRTFTSFGTAYALDVPRLAVPAGQVTFALLGRELAALWGARATTDNPQGQRIVEGILRDLDVDVVTAVAEHVRSYDFITRAQSFGGPILLVQGGRDHAVNVALGPTFEAMKGRENFTVVRMPEAGHCANLDDPKTLWSIVEAFLERHP